MGRYVRLVDRGWRTTDALEAVRAEMADPVSDCVLLTFEVAAEEGTAVVLRVLRGLLDQITADLALTERIETLQTQERIASKALLVMPYLMLLLLCTTTTTFRSFYQSGAGLAVVAVGRCRCGQGGRLSFAVRLGFPIPVESISMKVSDMEFLPVEGFLETHGRRGSRRRTYGEYWNSKDDRIDAARVHLVRRHPRKLPSPRASR